MSLSDLLLAFTAQFVALDIVGTLPMFIAITRDMDSAARRRIVDQSLLVAFSVALLFLLAGPLVLRSLEIKFYDFRIAGGLILLLVSLADLVGGPGAVHQSASGSTGVVPLAVPLITGPGVLTTIMLQGDKLGPLATLLAMAPNYLLAWFLLRRSDMVTHGDRLEDRRIAASVDCRGDDSRRSVCRCARISGALVRRFGPDSA